MRKVTVILFALFSIFILNCCQKKIDSSLSEGNPSYSDSIFLRIVQQTDTTVQLNWTQLDSDCFSKYIVFKRAGSDSSDMSFYTDTIKTIRRQNSLYFYDTIKPMFSEIKYQVCASSCKGLKYSNVVSVIRENILGFECQNLYDIVIDKDEKRFYVIDQSSSDFKILLLDYNNNKEICRINTDFMPGYGSIGYYNGSKEFYIIDETYNKIKIYNGDDLNLKGEITANNNYCSVVNMNDQLFSVSNNGGVVCYSRNTLSLISSVGNINYDTRLKHIPGTNKIMAVTMSGINPSAGYYKFTSDGNSLQYSETGLSYGGSGYIFEVSPNGEYFITGDRGYIYTANTSIAHINSIYDLCSIIIEDIAISEQGDKIYIADRYNKGISVLDYNTGSIIQTFNTQGFSKRIFIDNNELISISVEDNYNFYTYGIERFKL